MQPATERAWRTRWARERNRQGLLHRIVGVFGLPEQYSRERLLRGTVAEQLGLEVVRGHAGARTFRPEEPQEDAVEAMIRARAVPVAMLSTRLFER